MPDTASRLGQQAQDRAGLEQERVKRHAQVQVQVDGKGKGQSQATGITPIKLYLLAYNAISVILWANLLYITLSFLVSSRTNLFSKANTKGGSASAWWNRFVASSPYARQVFSSLPAPLATVEKYLSGSYEYKSLGWYTKYTQSLAILEVVHAALGWVRSPVLTTASQVASRVYTVWGVVEAVPETHSHPLFTTMLLAWSLTEVIRYSYYFLSLISIKSPILDYLRYTTFYPLYPLGAASEAFIAFSTLPSFVNFPLPDYIRNLNPIRSLVSSLPDSMRKALVSTAWGRRVLWNLARMGTKKHVQRAVGRAWEGVDYARLGLFVVWWPALFVLYTYMIGQRKKVLGKGRVGRTVRQGQGKTVGGVNKTK